MSDHREAIARLLYANQARQGEYFSTEGPWWDDADALLGSDVLAQIRAEARAEALREAADALNTTDHATETALQGVDHAIDFLRASAGGSA